VEARDGSGLGQVIALAQSGRLANSFVALASGRRRGTGSTGPRAVAAIAPWPATGRSGACAAGSSATARVSAPRMASQPSPTAWPPSQCSPAAVDSRACRRTKTLAKILPTNSNSLVSLMRSTAARTACSDQGFAPGRHQPRQRDCSPNYQPSTLNSINQPVCLHNPLKIRPLPNANRARSRARSE
jgi:hypothetical protein